MLLDQTVVPGLGHLSTLVADESSGAAAVVDPRRDVDVYLDAAREADLRITHVVETHLHNDYVSGGARAGGADRRAPRHRRRRGARPRPRPGPRRRDVRRRLAPVHRPRHARPHAGARRLRGRRHVAAARTRALAVHRRLAARRRGRPDRPARRGARRAVRPRDVPLAPRGRPRPRRPRRVHPTHGAGLALRDGHRLDADVDDRLREAPQPSSVRRRGATSRRSSRRLLRGQPAVPRYFARMRPTNQAGPGAPRRARPGAAAARTSRRRGARSRPAPCSSTSARRPSTPSQHAPGLAVDPARAVVRDVARLGRRAGPAARPRSSSGPSRLGRGDPPGAPDRRRGRDRSATSAAGSGPGPTAAAPLESSGRLNVDQLADAVAAGGAAAPLVIDVRQAQRVRDRATCPGMHLAAAGSLPRSSRRAARATGRSRRSARRASARRVAASILRAPASRTSPGSRAACPPGRPPASPWSAARVTKPGTRPPRRPARRSTATRD